jgi:tripartite-type tricarboxylate transporter receptor subunit TctC
MHRWPVGWLIVLTFSAGTVPSMAAEWPARTIHIVVPFGPAGVADRFARILADGLATELKPPVVVENRGGAGGLIAGAQVARAEPDGYTLLISGLATQVIAPALSANPGFAARDFTHIAYIGGPPVGWVVTPSTALQSVDDVVREARAGKLSGYASSGVGTLGHLVSEFVLQKAGVRLNHIPYNTAVVTDVIAGHVPLASYAWGSVAGPAQGGAVRAIAVSSEARLSGFPDVPTFREQGYDFAARTWMALSGPKGVPREIVQTLNDAVVKVLDRARQKLAPDAVEPVPMTPEQLAQLFEQETARWTPVARAAGAK